MLTSNEPRSQGALLMSRISIASVDAAPVVALRDGVETRALIDAKDQPLHLYVHRLQPGAGLAVTAAAADRWIYVWEGGVEAGGRRLGARGSAGVESGGEITVTADPSGARLLEFRATGRGAARGDGEVHLLPSEQVPHLAQAEGVDVRIALHADGECPGCPLWLHEVDYGANGVEKPHSHSADEIIFVRAGAMRFGSEVCGPGSALAIPGGARYSFAAGAEGMSFVNFRAGQSTYTPVGADAEIEEIKLWREYVAAPKYLAPAVQSSLSGACNAN
jgi:hypothetical protein